MGNGKVLDVLGLAVILVSRNHRPQTSDGETADVDFHRNVLTLPLFVTSCCIKVEPLVSTPTHGQVGERTGAELPAYLVGAVITFRYNNSNCSVPGHDNAQYFDDQGRVNMSLDETGEASTSVGLSLLLLTLDHCAASLSDLISPLKGVNVHLQKLAR